MKCPQDGTLQAYIDGQLPDLEQQATRAHLLSCAACGTRLGVMQRAANRAKEAIGTLAEAGPPPMMTPAKPIQNLRSNTLLGRILGVRIPLPWPFLAGMLLGLLFLLQLTHRQRQELDKLRPKTISSHETVLTITADNQIQQVPLGIDTRDYEPLSRPRMATFKE